MVINTLLKMDLAKSWHKADRMTFLSQCGNHDSTWRKHRKTDLATGSSKISCRPPFYPKPDRYKTTALQTEMFAGL
jgi:hypothetical protein